MNFAEYRQLDAVNWSTLREMAVSPKHYHHRLTTPRPDTGPMAFGRAVHTSVLEPDRLPLEYAIWSGGRRGTNAHKEWQAQQGGRQELSEGEYETCLDVRDAVHAHPVAANLLRGCQFETTVEWTMTGIDCKCRPDAVKKRTLIDLKTARTIDARKFGRNAYDLGYFGQMAFYAEGLAVSTGVGDWEAFLIAVEADQPHDVGVFHIDPDSLYAAGVKAHELLDRVAECRESGQWPGRYPQQQDLTLPAWEFVEDNDAELVISGLKSAEGFV